MAPSGSSSSDAVDGEELAVAALAVARRLADGATLWCVAPEWPEHGRHVAVEFVHPVVVGKRAFPAVSVGGPDPARTLRNAAVAGDVLVVVAPATSLVAADLVRRARPWGLRSVWLGGGERPIGAADHHVWVPGDADSAPHDGRLVLRYHLLWELTQVCMEHAELLAAPAASGGEVCITCSDEGRPGEVAALLGDGLVSVRTPQGVETVDAGLVEDVEPGDLLLVHAGAAIGRLDGGDG